MNPERNQFRVSVVSVVSLWRRTACQNGGYHKLHPRNGRFDQTEDDVGYHEGYHDVEGLSGQEGGKRLAVFLAEDFPETGLEADADEGYAEEGVLEALCDLAYGLGGLCLEAEAEDEGCEDESHHEFREAVPDEA